MLRKRRDDAHGPPLPAAIDVDEIFERLFPLETGPDGTAMRAARPAKGAALTDFEKLEISKMLMASDDAETYSGRMASASRLAADELTPVRIEYRDLSVVVQASPSSESNPSLVNGVLGFLRFLTLRTRAVKKPLQVLKPSSGVLEPGRMTLLLGPPGSGKTVFMQALSGRLEETASLRITGTVSYNGIERGEVNPKRIVGYVGQRDLHIPNLQVIETLEFVHACLTDPRDERNTLERFLRLEEDLERDGASDAAGSAADGFAAAPAHAAKSSPPAAARPVANGSPPAAARPVANGSPPAAARPVANGSPPAAARPVANGSPPAAARPVANGSPPAAAGRDGAPRPPGADASVQRRFVRLVLIAIAAQLLPYNVMDVMGLSHTAHTVVGNQMVRGVSGGERRRVSSAEVLVGPQMAMFGDEISTGLDSATTYSVVRYLKDATHQLRKTTLLLLLQPAPEVMELFDDLILLTDGRVLYHGPMGRVMDFFASQGFVCPPRKDPGAFLMEVTTPAGQAAYATRELLVSRGVDPAVQDPHHLLVHPPRSALVSSAEIADAFWASPEWGRPILEGLARAPEAPPPPQHDRKYARSSLALTKLVLKRQILLTFARGKFIFFFRCTQATVVALLVGSLFVNLEPGYDTWRSFAAVCTITAMFLAFMNFPQVAIVFATRDVFFKQRAAGLFPPAAYSMALTISQIPYSTIEATTFSLVVYWMTGLAASPGRYFTYLVVAWSASNALGAMFRTIAFASATMTVAHCVGMLILVFLVSLNGFMIPKPNIRGYVIWVYWASPIAWPVRALCVNEFTASDWDMPVPGTSQRLGDFALESFGFTTDMSYVYASIGICWGLLFLYAGLGAAVLRWIPAPAPSAVLPPEQPTDLEGWTLDESLQRAAPLKDDSSLPPTGGGGGDGGGGISGGGRGIGTDCGDDAAGRDLIEKNRGTTGSLESASLAPPLGKPTPSDSSLVHLDVPLAARDHEARRGVRGGVHRTSLYDGSAMPGAGKPDSAGEAGDLGFQPIALVCRDLCYYVKDPSKGVHPGVVKESSEPELVGKLQLLHDINFFAEPKHLVALMGGSGAGKTTLMDVVCGRKTVGITRGEILVNGHPKVQETWSRVVGYVEQSDVHSAGVTVYESLLFSARMRLPGSTPLAEVREIVESTLEMVELDVQASRVVGDPGGSGLSSEQRKRLSIAVELVANPSVVFMDEPTSGLDARAAAIVMRAVRSVADSRRTVMVTIHQPSIELFEAFDTMVLMHRGGRLAYFGELGFESSKLVEYLEGYGVERLRPGHNPATWMLEVTGGSMSTTFKATDLDFPQLYLESDLFRANEARAEELVARGLATTEPLTMAARYATSLRVQSFWLLRKFFQIYWHSPGYVLVRLVMAFLLAVGTGIIFLRRGNIKAGEQLSFADVQSVIGSTFCSLVFMGVYNLMSIQPTIFSERLVFYRERAASYYSAGPYALAMVLVEVPFLVIQTFTISIPMYLLFDFEKVWWKYWYYSLLLFETITIYTYMGVILVLITPVPLAAQLLSQVVQQLFIFFNGFLKPYPQIGKGWKWMNRVVPPTWILYGITASQLGSRDELAVGPSGDLVSLSKLLDSFYDYQYDMVWWCPLILLGYILVFIAGCVLALRYVSFLKR